MVSGFTPDATPETESVDETNATPEAETVDDTNATPEAETVDDTDETPEAEAMDEAEPVDVPETVPPTETAFPPRELMAVSHPRLLAANPVPVPARRAVARRPYRMAGAFRTRRKRPVPGRRKPRRIARPRRVTATEIPSDVSEPPPRPVPPRKLSGKIVRRCLHCLLCGCWLSWPFCSF